MNGVGQAVNTATEAAIQGNIIAVLLLVVALAIGYLAVERFLFTRKQKHGDDSELSAAKAADVARVASELREHAEEELLERRRIAGHLEQVSENLKLMRTNNQRDHERIATLLEKATEHLVRLDEKVNHLNKPNH